MGLVSELRRRNVIKVAVAYAVVTWLLIQVADTTFPILKLPEWSVTLVTALLLIGFPLALIFAWAFELTPEGIKLERHVDRSKSITHLTGRKLDYVIIAVLALALGYFAFDKFVLDQSREAELVRTTTEAVTGQVAKTATADKSIAVLPFADMSPDGDQEYFSDGISEELLNVLSKIPGLRVTARTSSFQFKGDNRDIIDIGKQLNVGHILEGSVRKSGNQLRITAQLIKADDGFHLWSDSYDRELDDIFGIQEDIAQAIVNALKIELGLSIGTAPRITAVSREAHDAYLLGRHLVAQRTQATIEGAVRQFEKAIALDPDYAVAHAELAVAILLLDQYGDLTYGEAVARAAQHAERAMALDPSLAEAHAAYGFLLDRNLNFEEALNHYREALRINPNYAIVYLWMGRLLGFDLGNYKEGFDVRETGLRLDPLSLPLRIVYVNLLINRNRLVEARRELQKMAAIDPYRFSVGRARLAAHQGRWTEAILAGLDALRINPGEQFGQDYLPQLFAVLGLEREALAFSDSPSTPVLILLGKHEEAVRSAEQRFAQDPTSLGARRNLALAFAGAGDYARAGPILEELWQLSDGRIAGLFVTHSAIALIAIRQAAGNDDLTGELLAALKDDVRRLREAGITGRYDDFYDVVYDDGLTALFAGERERGLALISQAVQNGHYIPPNLAYLQRLYDDPGFATVRSSQEAWQVRERDELLSVVCTENRWADVWAPQAETCEQFIAAALNK